MANQDKKHFTAKKGKMSMRVDFNDDCEMYKVVCTAGTRKDTYWVIEKDIESHVAFCTGKTIDEHLKTEKP